MAVTLKVTEEPAHTACVAGGTVIAGGAFTVTLTVLVRSASQLVVALVALTLIETLDAIALLVNTRFPPVPACDVLNTVLSALLSN